MGSNYKQAVLPPSVGGTLHRWHKDAKRRMKMSFSFGPMKNKPSPSEVQSLKDNDGNSLSAPEHLVMEDIPVERYNMIPLFT